MKSLDAAQSTGEVAQTLKAVLQKGVKIWSEKGQLHYKAPRGALSSEEIARLAAFSEQIVAIVERSFGRQPMPQLRPRRAADRVPLTFSQLRYWNAERLGERTSVRSVARAIRLRGVLDVGLLRCSVTELVRRHEALRTRIVVDHGYPTQEVSQPSAVDIDVSDLRVVPEHAQPAELERVIHELILQPVHVTVGPLFEARLVRLCDDDHVLVVVMEHIVSDGASINLLIRDLVALYQQAEQRGGGGLPDVPIQFPDYAVWQARTHGMWIKQHGAYWDRRLVGCGRLAFHPKGADTRTDGAAAGVLQLRVERAMRQALNEWCRYRRTTMVMSVFSVFVALVLRSCNRSEGIIRYQTDGRFDPLVAGTIGYFASVLNLRMELQPDDTFVDLLCRVTREYCAACDHADFSRLDARNPPPEFTANPSFNWVPAARDALREVPQVQAGLTFEAIKFALPAPPVDRMGRYAWQAEPALILRDEGDVIEGRVLYAQGENAGGAIDAFRDNFLTLLAELIREPQQRVLDVRLR